MGNGMVTAILIKYNINDNLIDVSRKPIANKSSRPLHAQLPHRAEVGLDMYSHSDAEDENLRYFEEYKKLYRTAFYIQSQIR
jgi:hypothetical protein